MKKNIGQAILVGKCWHCRINKQSRLNQSQHCVVFLFCFSSSILCRVFLYFIFFFLCTLCCQFLWMIFPSVLSKVYQTVIAISFEKSPTYIVLLALNFFLSERIQSPKIYNLNRFLEIFISFHFFFGFYTMMFITIKYDKTFNLKK